MKSIFLLTAFLFSFVAQATVANYNCELENDSDARNVQSLNLPKYNKGELIVPFSQCRLTKQNAHYDICQVGQTTLVIGVNPLKSVLLTRTGKAFEFSCSEESVETPTEPQEPDETEEDPCEGEGEECEQEEQQQEQQSENPGHGGSNIRMRGIRTTPKA